jgi:hypothetical protein
MKAENDLISIDGVEEPRGLGELDRSFRKYGWSHSINPDE